MKEQIKGKGELTWRLILTLAAMILLSVLLHVTVSDWSQRRPRVTEKPIAVADNCGEG